ncbi:MAG: aldo/keto reductase [Haloarculaceae archaeon]
MGTYSASNREQWTGNVWRALETGYRHVDTTQAYGNEQYVGESMARADVPREEVFLATKTAHPDHPVPEREDVQSAVEGCLDRLGTDYVDLLYVHWPADPYDPETTLGAFDELHDAGTVRHVGVSNFEPDQLDRAREVLDAPLFANQVEMHPLLGQDHLLEYTREHDLWLVAYCPIARNEVADVPAVVEVAEKHDATPAQVSLAWLLAKEHVAAIPKAADERHRRENLAARNLDLDPEDLARIDGIDREHRIIDREYAPWRR